MLENDGAHSDCHRNSRRVRVRLHPLQSILELFFVCELTLVFLIDLVCEHHHDVIQGITPILNHLQEHGHLFDGLLTCAVIYNDKALLISPVL